MSCNYCDFQRIKKKAAETGYRRPDVMPRRSKMFPKGVDVFIGPKFVAWFGELPERCVCT